MSLSVKRCSDLFKHFDRNAQPTPKSMAVYFGEAAQRFEPTDSCHKASADNRFGVAAFIEAEWPDGDAVAANSVSRSGWLQWD